MTLIYAGVIPYAYDPTGQVRILLGNEEGGWSDFGGTPEPGESPKETAGREAYEESMGMFGSVKSIKSCLTEEQSLWEYDNNGQPIAVHYLKLIHYDTNISALFRNTFKYFDELFSSISIDPDDLDGVLEKCDVRWFTLHDLHRHRTLRKSFVKIVPALRERFGH
jgi:8-oxo-dGTP pyrophosphatase MutT (NUDIX family)